MAYQPVNGADACHDDGDEGLHEKLRLRDATNGHSFCCLGRAICSAHGCGEGGGCGSVVGMKKDFGFETGHKKGRLARGDASPWLRTGTIPDIPIAIVAPMAPKNFEYDGQSIPWGEWN